MIMTVKSSPVPDVSAPEMSASAASNPTVIAHIIVSGVIYLFSNASTTLSSFLNPGTWSPDAMICFAWLFASIPAVCTQNQEKRMQSPTKMMR